MPDVREDPGQVDLVQLDIELLLAEVVLPACFDNHARDTSASGLDSDPGRDGRVIDTGRVVGDNRAGQDERHIALIPGSEPAGPGHRDVA